MFDGFEIQATIGKGLPIGDVAIAGIFGDRELHEGDQFEVTVRYVVGKATFGSDKYDADGNAIGKKSQTHYFHPLLSGFGVTAYVGRDELGKAWEQTA